MRQRITAVGHTITAAIIPPTLITNFPARRVTYTFTLRPTIPAACRDRPRRRPAAFIFAARVPRNACHRIEPIVDFSA